VLCYITYKYSDQALPVKIGMSLVYLHQSATNQRIGRARAWIWSTADTIHIQYGPCRYDAHVHDLNFQNQEFWISTAK